uniref:Sulfotransferase n=1 Tax=Plectus sambesii TaxID=2011161 RepID=A0A914VJT4_9BILA
MKNQLLDNKRQRTIDFLSGAALNLRRYDILDSSMSFNAVKVQVCLIQKNGLATIRYVGCSLALLEKGYVQEYSEFSKLSSYEAAFNNTCLNFTTFKDRDGYEKLVFIRDPLERFVSGWMYLCKRKGACFDCGQDIKCFLRTFFYCWSTDMKYSSTCTYRPPKNSGAKTSSQHIFFHISPQAAYCRMSDNFNPKDVRIIPYSRENVNSFLRSAAKPVMNSEQLEMLSSRLEEPSEHASDQVEARKLKQKIMDDWTLTTLFSTIYFIDYQTFSIDLPQFMLDAEMYKVDQSNVPFFLM